MLKWDRATLSIKYPGLGIEHPASSNLLQRTKVRRQFRRLSFDQIGFDVLDDPVAHARR